VTDRPAAELRRIATEIVVTVGREVRAARATGTGDVSTKSTSTDVVTAHDRAAEARIRELIHLVRPGDAVFGEEGTDHSGTSGITWLVDPIDGTTNFLYDLPGYGISLAAVDALGSVAGAVHVPSSDEVFSAHRGGGATLDGRPIRCSPVSTLDRALVGTGFGYLADRRTAQATMLARIIGDVRDIRRFGAASVDLCHTACGRLDVYYEEHLQPWDIAAGSLIALEAGCRLGDFSGGPLRPEEALVAPPQLFDAMVALIDTARA
jgi:myo-inositol-1(or 4)-monophosphatase